MKLFSKNTKYLLFVFVLVTSLFIFKNKDDLLRRYQKNSLPDAKTFQEAIVIDNPNITKLNTDEPLPVQESNLVEQKILPNEINLKVPFALQAPGGDWSETYKEACEEASLLMIKGYLENQKIFDSQELKKQINDLVAFQIKTIGEHKDLNINETASLAQDYFGFTTEIITDLSIENIKLQLTSGRPVIVPVAGQLLGNPYFRQPGPIYHMLVIKGYVDDSFITNDPGTKRGEDYIYKQEKLLSAIADWTGSSADGNKVGLVILP